jgi:hypothetical protein
MRDGITIYTSCSNKKRKKSRVAYLLQSRFILREVLYALVDIVVREAGSILSVLEHRGRIGGPPWHVAGLLNSFPLQMHPVPSGVDSQPPF